MEKEKKEFLQKEQDLNAEIEKLCEKGRRYKHGKESIYSEQGTKVLCDPDVYLIEQKRIAPNFLEAASMLVNRLGQTSMVWSGSATDGTLFVYRGSHSEFLGRGLLLCLLGVCPGSAWQG